MSLEPTVADSSADAHPPENSVARVVLASFIGTTIEWYDFFLYGIVTALVFDKLFFSPQLGSFAGTMAAFSLYSVGFVARPIGGVVFGHFGDRMGRKSMLVTTLMMMGVATFLIGLLPTYEQIGVAAPMLLALLRFIQGLGVGGEWGGAVLMVVEHGHRGQRGLYASCVQAGSPAGLLLATVVFSLFSSLPDKEFLSWGWRVPFLLGIGLLAAGLFIRLRIIESPLFAKNLESKPTRPLPLFDVIRRYPKNILLAMGARFAENASFYIFSAYVFTYATKQLHVPREVVLKGVIIGSMVHLVTIPLFGMLSDRIGRRPVYLAGAAALAVYAFPFFKLMDTAEPKLIALAIAIGFVVHAAMYAPQASFFAELFGTDVRYTGASIGAQLSSPLAGGVAPLICVALIEWSGGKPWPVSIYMIVLAAITLVSVWLAAETHRAELRD